MEDDKKRIRLTIILGVMVFIIIPSLIAMIFAVSRIRPTITTEIALNTSVDSAIADAVSTENGINLDQAVVHELARDGDYIAVGVFNVRNTNDFGNNTTIILHKTPDGYQSVFAGTTYDFAELAELGVPNGLIDQLKNTDLVGAYLDVINSSDMNPRNSYPLIRDLPYTTDDLTITYYFKDGLVDNDGVSIPIIDIDGVDAVERTRGLNKIRDLGYDPGDYQIIFSNLVNPFTGEDGAAIIENESESTEPLEDTETIDPTLIDDTEGEGP